MQQLEKCGWMEGTLQWSANQTSKQLLQSSEMGLLGVLLPAVCCFFLIQVVFGAYQCKSVPVKFCSHLFWLLWWWISFPYDPLWSSTLIGQYWIEVVKFACSIKHLAWKPDSSIEKESSGQLSNCKNCNATVFVCSHCGWLTCWLGCIWCSCSWKAFYLSPRLFQFTMKRWNLSVTDKSQVQCGPTLEQHEKEHDRVLHGKPLSGKEVISSVINIFYQYPLLASRWLWPWLRSRGLPWGGAGSWVWWAYSRGKPAKTWDDCRQVVWPLFNIIQWTHHLREKFKKKSN